MGVISWVLHLKLITITYLNIGDIGILKKQDK